MLLQKHNSSLIVRRQRAESWKDLYQQLHQHKIASIIAIHNKRPHKRTSHLNAIKKLELLTAYLITKKKQERNNKILKKWRQVVTKVISINNFA